MAARFAARTSLTVSPHWREEDQVRYRAGALPRVTSPVRVLTTSTAQGASPRWSVAFVAYFAA
jgi:hypothetical protein